MDDAKVDLERNLEVVPRTGNPLISVSMSTRVPRDAMVIVKAAIKAHVAGRTEMLHDMQLKQMETLDRSINGYNDLINTYEVDMKARQAQFIKKYLANSNGGSGGLEAILTYALARQDRSHADLEDATSQFESFSDELKNKITPLELQEYLGRLGGPSNQGRVLNLSETLSMMQAVYGPESPQIKRLEQQLATARETAEEGDAKRKDDMITAVRRLNWRAGEACQAAVRCCHDQP